MNKSAIIYIAKLLAERFFGIILYLFSIEDRMLKNGLSGYDEYSKKVKYRLIPFLW